MSIALSRLDLHRGERGFLLGGTGSGKSTLEERLMYRFLSRYSNSRICILDSKPRFRAEFLPDGMSAKRLYRHWDHGPYIPNSMLVQEPSQLAGVWKFGHRVAIVQCSSQPERIKLALAAAEFLKSSRTGRPQLLAVDETMDFFTPQGSSLRGHPDSILQTVRGGRERGTGALLCSQRAKGIPGQVLSDMTKLYLFRLDFRADVRYLPEMGVPEAIESPEDDYEFLYWTKKPSTERKRIYGPYQLSLTN